MVISPKLTLADLSNGDLVSLEYVQTCGQCSRPEIQYVWILNFICLLADYR